MKHRVATPLILLVALVFISTGELSAQLNRDLNIKEAIDLSIQSSKQLKASRARIDEATANSIEAQERKLPEAGFMGSYVRLNSPNINVKNKSTNSPGGTGAQPQNPANPSSAIYGILNASLPIYSGKRITYGIESSKYLEQAAKLDADNDREAIVLNTINAFNNLYKSKAAVVLVAENLEGAKHRVKDLMNLEKNGLLPRNDLLKAQLQQSNVELSLLDAENNWKLANINMNLMLGLPDNTELNIKDSNLPLGYQLKNSRRIY